MSRFWETEEMGVCLNWCCQERQLGEKIKTAIEGKEELEIRSSAIRIGNRWQIPLPWKKDPNQLLDNYYQAFAKLRGLEQRLQKSPKLAEIYNEQVEQLVKSGSAKKMTAEEIENYRGPVHYMSHHAVVRPDKPTHPCRMVFNQAENYRGHVINDYLSKCGDHLNNLLGVLIRWREREYVLVGDVKKMYHQVLVSPGFDTQTHRFLWRNYESNRDPDIYVKMVLTFGDVSSPALANIAMDMTADQYKTQYPDAVATIKQCRYMDDIADSVNTVFDLEKRRCEIDKILESGHFQIKHWYSNA
ncbi:uncharacterized protein LOC141904310 [Tubulanus polymorphus]|uniref:uncharacterized protein LOC141904310 n=1 Tax=Tubulanus polymorphus TaxID=672921 RepID=UPI003DA6340B